MEVLTQKLQKDKHKHVDNRQAEAIAIQDAIMEGDDEGEVELEDVVK